MGNGFSMKFDDGGIHAILQQLGGPVVTAVGRSMAVAGGKLLRDEAKIRAPVKSGRLQSSIYLAYRDKQSTDGKVIYSVTWNSKKAPHGHLVEFGTFAAAAHPFLRPAFEANVQRVQSVMFDRGRERLAEILRDLYTIRDEEFA